MAGGGLDSYELFAEWGGPAPPSIVFPSPLPSPRTLFPSFAPSDASFTAGKMIGAEEGEGKNDGEEGAPGVVDDGTSLDNGGRTLPVSGRSGGSIAERRAARTGFNAARLNTARFRTKSPLSSPAIQSPYLTIPPGLSPTTLLDSPVMFLNSLSQPSPTTGTFPVPSISDQNPISVLACDENKAKHVAEIESSSFVFKPRMDMDANDKCPIDLQNLVSTNSTDIEQHMDTIEPHCPSQRQTQLEGGIENKKMTAEKGSHNDSVSFVEIHSSVISDVDFIGLNPQPWEVGNEEDTRSEGLKNVDNTSTQMILDEESFPAIGMGRPSEDGYNWRKYGQKQVKGSEYPRSYYKCTHPSCQVKKKVERSHDGQITEIIYKGSHNHPKPQPNQRSLISTAFALNEMSESPEGGGSLVKLEGCTPWRNIHHHGNLKDMSEMDWRFDGIERTSSTSGVTDVSDPSSTTRAKHLNQLKFADTPELSSSDEQRDEEEDRVTQGSVSLGDDGEDDESESKRRKKDTSIIEANLSLRAVREPRVVVQTTSEIDILDDGYRWRKYGQKVVKGNPNPRSYYKCTNPGCSVRKHVERASHDIKSVITTYEGKHNHEVPVGRNSSHGHGSSGCGNLGPLAGSSESVPTFAASIAKSQSRVDNFTPCFKPDEYLKAAAYLRNLSGDIKRGTAPGYDMKLPSLQLMPCASFASATNMDSHPLIALSQTSTNMAAPMPVGLQSVGNLVLPMGFGFNPGKVLDVHPYHGQQQNREGDIRLLRPKEEQKDDTSYEGGFGMSHPPNHTSMYNQILGRFPL